MGVLDWFRRDNGKYEQHLRNTARKARQQQDLVNAAGVGLARLRCHKDTWAYLADAVAGERHSHGPGRVFRAPAAQDISNEGNGMIVVPLSGSSLAALLSFCRTSQGVIGNWSPLEQAIGQRTEAAICAALERVEPADGDHSDSAVIVLDDQPAPAKTSV
ncbi:hypothetical protein P3T27_007978 [Kitasatospora sp. MAA19]|uniref:hypothetical protein n=1 Tax=unclassified Kitasatospora TaxID=2633591 RepID=UPI002476DF36|nr:hypothetical protein [Kitasatospora sp. MAA19]MDH6711225.1 hypothetical protein [Kitasatospora sp. MAA19]